MIMDLIMYLLQMPYNHIAVAIFVDQLLKQLYLAKLCLDIDVPLLVQIFFNIIFYHH